MCPAGGSPICRHSEGKRRAGVGFCMAVLLVLYYIAQIWSPVDAAWADMVLLAFTGICASASRSAEEGLAEGSRQGLHYLRLSWTLCCGSSPIGFQHVHSSMVVVCKLQCCVLGSVQRYQDFGDDCQYIGAPAKYLEPVRNCRPGSCVASLFIECSVRR